MNKVKTRKPSHVVTVDVIVKCKDEVLFIRRAKEPCVGKLALPGGHVEVSDFSLREAAVRELEEETGIKVRKEQLVWKTVLSDKGRDPRYEQSMSVVFSVELNYWPKLALTGDDGVASLEVHNLLDLDTSQLAFDHLKALELVIPQYEHRPFCGIA